MKRFRILWVCLVGGLAGALLVWFWASSGKDAAEALLVPPTEVSSALSSEELEPPPPMAGVAGRVLMPEPPEGAEVAPIVISAEEERADPALKVAIERATMRYSEPRRVAPGQAPVVERILVGNVRKARAALFAQLARMSERETLRILVTLADIALADGVLARYDLTEVNRAKAVVQCEGARDSVARLLNEMPEGVRFVEEAPVATLQNTVATGSRFLGLSAPLRTTSSRLDGRGEVVSIFDTGISSGDPTSSFHTALLPSLFGMAVAPSVASSLTTLTVEDVSGHGTHVAGSVASTGSSTKGAAPGAVVYMHRISDDNSSIPTPAVPSSLFGQGVLVGARLISFSVTVSLKSGAFYYGTDAGDLDQFAWDNPEVLVVKAAGNTGVDADSDGVVDESSITCLYSQAKNLLVVGAQENYRATYSSVYSGTYGSQILADKVASPYDGENDGMAAFSSRGPLNDGRVGPTLVAPGTAILSTYIGSSAAMAYLAGTSMATPLVSGSAAVFRQYLREQWGFDGTDQSEPTSALVRAGLILCSESLYPGQYGTDKLEIPEDSPNSVEGWGALHLGTHLEGEETFGFEDRISLSTGETATFTIPGVTAGTELAVVLTWIDAPGVLETANRNSSSADLVNDYDLTVTSPSGETFTLGDTLNPQERIIIASAEEGDYTITVSGTSINTTGSGNLAAIAWRATTSAGATGVPATSSETEMVTVTVNMPSDATAYVDYAFYPAPGTTSFTKGETLIARASPKLFATDYEDAIYPSYYTVTWADGTTTSGRVAQDGATTLTLTLDQDVTIDWIGTTEGITWTSTAVDDYVTLGVPNGSATAVDTTTAGEVILPNMLDDSMVTAVARKAFLDCTELTAVTIPHGVASIGASAFSGCSALTEATLPNTLKTIGESAFAGTALTLVTFLGEPPTSVGTSAFSATCVVYGTYEADYASAWETEITNGLWNGVHMAEAGTLAAQYRVLGEGSVAASSDGTRVTATAAEGYIFYGWSDGSKSASRTIAEDGDDMVTAIFVPSGTVEVTYTAAEVETATRGVAFDAPAMSVGDETVSMGFSLQVEGEDGTWSTIDLSEATVTQDESTGTISVTLPNPSEGGIFYQFTEGPTAEAE